MTNPVPIVYVYDQDKYFVSSAPLQPNPRSPGTFFEKANSTTVEPKLQEGFWAKWDGEKWTLEKKPTTPDEMVGMEISHEKQTPRAIELRAIKDKLITPESGYKQELVDGYWVVTKIPEPTDEEKKEQQASEIRLKRNALITATDYLLLSDNPKKLSEEQLKEVEAYRDALRDVPQQEGFPENVEWPVVPACID